MGRETAPKRRTGADRAFGAALLLAVVAALAARPAHAAGGRVPLPQPRPEAAGPPHATEPADAQPESEKPENGERSAAEIEAEACLSRLRAANVEFEAAAMPVAARSACAIETPVRLKAVRSRARRETVRLPEEPVVSCRFAERLASFLGELAAPLISGRLATAVTAVRTGPGYECRNRNRSANGKLSAHALGEAVDIAGFDLADGRTLHVKPEGDDGMRSAVHALRTAACGWFTTVLGPGSDAAHADHMHVDIMVHGSSDRYRICQ